MIVDGNTPVEISGPVYMRLTSPPDRAGGPRRDEFDLCLYEMRKLSQLGRLASYRCMLRCIMGF